MPTPETYTFYFAGELFSAKHLYGNAVLAEAIQALSEGRYEAILPQDLKQEDVTSKGIRDQDIRALLDCDLGLFHYDGPELDSGTVVEYMFAKFADIPSVLLRTDFRRSGDQQSDSGDSWNLMSSFYPRTRVVQLNAMALYQTDLCGNGGAERPVESAGQRAGQSMTEHIAREVIKSFDELLALPPVLPKELTESVYRWLALMPGLSGTNAENTTASLNRLLRKQGKRLL